MKRHSILLAVALLALLVAAPSVQAAKVTPFVGAWTGNDPAPPDGDGSTLYLTISGGGTVHLTFIDTFGTICGREGSPTDVFVSRLTGAVSGDTLNATFTSARCGRVFFDFLVGSPATYLYDAATDTLSDGFVTWHRHSH
jgi:hypothetical protein